VGSLQSAAGERGLEPSPAEAAYLRLREADQRHGAVPLPQRLDLLARLEQALVARRHEVVAAVQADYGRRSAEETLISEVLVVVNAIRYARPRLKRWSRPRRVPVGGPFWPSRAWVVPQPLGVVGVLAPWNYPVQLALSPLVSALGAGNRVLVKPSEATPRTAELIADLVETTLGGEIAQVLLGGPEIAEALTRLPLDHVLFTGSAATGRKVMRAAAETLTPLTLELGGKCPAVILPDADLEAAARALVNGKGLNAGQTCIAPDTVLLVGHSVETFREAFARAYAACFPEGPDTAIVSDAHAARVEALARGADLEPLGPASGARLPPLSLAPSPGPGSPLLCEEVFGPILPLLPLPSLDEAIAWINARPSPLAVYLFTRDRRSEARMLERTRAGALVVNGTVVQAAVEALPFGGVGGSGFGRYHGRAGFDTFSNPRAYLRQSRFSLSRLTDRPYTERTRALIERLIEGRYGRFGG